MSLVPPTAKTWSTPSIAPPPGGFAPPMSPPGGFAPPMSPPGGFSPPNFNNQTPFAQPFPMPSQAPSMNYKSLLKQRTKSAADVSIKKFVSASQNAEKHTLFVISMKLAGILPGKDIEWSVEHRQSEFEKLHTSLKQHIKTKGLENSLKFPSHTIFHHHNDDFNKKLMGELEAWLKLLYNYFDPLEVSDFDTFFAL